MKEFHFFIPLVLHEGGHCGYIEVSSSSFMSALRETKRGRGFLGIDVHDFSMVRCYYIRHITEFSYNFMYL